MTKEIGSLFGQKMYHHQYGILDFCQKLHGFCTGSREYCQAFEPFFMKTYLEAKLANWTDASNKFDNKGKELILITLEECSNTSWFPTFEQAKDCYERSPKYWDEELRRLQGITWLIS